MRRRVCLVLGSAVLLASGCAPLVASFDLGGDEAKSFALAVAAGEPRRAYELLCPALRFGIPFGAFRDAVEANAFLIAATGVTIDEYHSGGGLAVVQSGWLESTSGVTAVAFYLSKADEAWCLTGVEIGGTPALPVPGTSVATAGGGGLAAAADRAHLPSPLRNAAYQVYGLANPATRRYRITGRDENGATGTQRADLLEAGARTARFRIVRGGALAALGSLDVSLEADGVYLVGSSQGSLYGATRTLVLPAKLEPGATWQSEYVLGTPGGGEMRYRGTDVVEGRETVRTPAGEFDAIRIVSNATVDSGKTHGVIRTVVWYAPDVGSVRTESATTIDGNVSQVVVELVDRGDAGRDVSQLESSD